MQPPCNDRGLSVWFCWHDRQVGDLTEWSIFLRPPPHPPRDRGAISGNITRPQLRLIVAKTKTAPRPVRIKKKTCIGRSVRSRLTRRGNTRKKYRGQGR